MPHIHGQSSSNKSNQQATKTIRTSYHQRIPGLRRREHSKLPIMITWIPDHQEIEGNEHADAEAKKAATEPTASQQFKHRPLKSTCVRNIKTATKEQ